MRRSFIPLIFILPVALLFHCRPERTFIEDNDALVEFSLDTVLFDTIFTTIGTTTKSFRIYNPHSRFISIDEIALAGGENSVFRINVDGVPGVTFNDFEIAPKDSMYVFVEATLDPNENPEILLIKDSITFSVNGNFQDVDLLAWGQDVHLIRNDSITTSQTWIADKPYLILEYLRVDSLQTLTVEEGVRIHMHNDAILHIKGSLVINGSLDNPVIIEGDRLEYDYRDIPGQWGFIFFENGSKENRIEHTLIKNGTIGLWVNTPIYEETPALVLSNVEINHMGYDGIYAQATSIEASNLVIGNCGNSCLELLYEGSYTFTHCTFANYWNNNYSNRKTPAVFIANFLAYKDTADQVVIDVSDIDKAYFRNSIIHGSETNEIEISWASDGILDYSFDRCLTKIDLEEFDYRNDPKFIEIINNENPLFDSAGYDYRIDSLSPVIDKGYLNYALEYQKDKKGDFRTSDGLPDLGAYEWEQE